MKYPETGHAPIHRIVPPGATVASQNLAGFEGEGGLAKAFARHSPCRISAGKRRAAEPAVVPAIKRINKKMIHS
jgi:hypothetical protein